MIDKLSVAIIGGGVNSAVGMAHYLAIKMSNKFEIIYGCFSRDSKTNKETAQEYGLPLEYIYRDWKEMVLEQKHKIECVIILTPTNQHYEQIKFISDLGLSIICEKTLTSNVEQISDIESISNNSFISVVFNYICYPMIKELKNKILLGKLGKINQIRIEMPQEGYIRKRKNEQIRPQKWRLEENNISNLLLDLGSHAYSIIKFLTEKVPLETVSIMNNFGDYSGVIDDINCSIKYTDNLVGNIWISKSSLGHKNGLRVSVYGTEGSAEWYQMNPELLKIVDKYGTISYLDRGSEDCSVSSQKRFNRFKPGHPDGFIESLSNYYEDVSNDLIMRKNENTYGIQQSKECMLLLRAIHQSSNEQKWISVK